MKGAEMFCEADIENTVMHCSSPPQDCEPHWHFLAITIPHPQDISGLTLVTTTHHGEDLVVLGAVPRDRVNGLRGGRAGHRGL